MDTSDYLVAWPVYERYFDHLFQVDQDYRWLPGQTTARQVAVEIDVDITSLPLPAKVRKAIIEIYGGGRAKFSCILDCVAIVNEIVHIAEIDEGKHAARPILEEALRGCLVLLALENPKNLLLRNAVEGRYLVMLRLNPDAAVHVSGVEVGMKLEVPADDTGRYEYRLQFLYQRIKTMTVDDLAARGKRCEITVFEEAGDGSEESGDIWRHPAYSDGPAPFLLRLRARVDPRFGAQAGRLV